MFILISKIADPQSVHPVPTLWVGATGRTAGFRTVFRQFPTPQHFSGWIIIPVPAWVSRREHAGLTQTVRRHSSSQCN